MTLYKTFYYFSFYPRWLCIWRYIQLVGAVVVVAIAFTTCFYALHYNCRWHLFFFLFVFPVWILCYTSKQQHSQFQLWGQEYNSNWTIRWKTLSVFFSSIKFFLILWHFSRTHTHTLIANENTQDVLIKMKRIWRWRRRWQIGRKKYEQTWFWKWQNQFLESMMKDEKTVEMEIYVWMLLCDMDAFQRNSSHYMDDGTF